MTSGSGVMSSDSKSPLAVGPDRPPTGGMAAPAPGTARNSAYLSSGSTHAPSTMGSTIHLEKKAEAEADSGSTKEELTPDIDEEDAMEYPKGATLAFIVVALV